MSKCTPPQNEGLEALQITPLQGRMIFQIIFYVPAVSFPSFRGVWFAPRYATLKHDDYSFSMIGPWFPERKVKQVY